MAENIHQVYQGNPITTNQPNDLMYFGQYPYGITNDAAMLYSNFAAQTYGISNYIVGETTATAPYTSIQAAVTAAALVATANNRQIVYIQSGNYTENVTLAPYVDICGLMSSFINNNYPVKIIGTFTIPGTASSVFNLMNLSINSNGNAPIVISGTLAVTLNMNNCLLNGSGQNGITSTNTSASIVLQSTSIFSNVSPFVLSGGNLTVYQGFINGSSADSTLAGTGSSLNFVGVSLGISINVTGTSCAVIMTDVALGAGASSCINLSGTTNTATIVNCKFNSSNTHVITGASGNTVSFSGLIFSGTSSSINPVLTLQPLNGAFGPMTFDGTNYLNPFLTGNANPTFETGSYQLIGDSLTQSMVDKAISLSSLDSSTITSACEWVDGSDATKILVNHLSAKTTGTTSTQVYSGGNQTITYPTGDFTVAKQGDNVIGNVTPYVVGTSSATAPYTTVNSALTAANAAFISTGFKQTVFIQPGTYSASVTPLAGVDIVGLGYSNSFYSTANLPTCAVKITGQLILTNTMDINIVGIQFNTTGASPTITSSGSNTPNVNFVNCILQKTGSSSQSMFSNSNANLIATFSNCLFDGGSGVQVFNVTAGNFVINGCTQQSATNAVSQFTGAQVYYANCIINDTLQLGAATFLTLYFSTLTTGGNFSAVIFQDPTVQMVSNYCTFSAGAGFTNYVFSGTGGVLQINNATYTDLAQLDPLLGSVVSFAQSPNLGNPTVYTSGPVPLSPQYSIAAIANATAAPLVVDLPAVGFAIGQTYIIVDQGRNAATYNITLTPASGNINGASTFAMNIDGQSVTVMDFGVEYTII